MLTGLVSSNDQSIQADVNKALRQQGKCILHPVVCLRGGE